MVFQSTLIGVMITMKLTNKQYDIIKFILFTVVPALTTLIGGLGMLYEFDVTQIVTLIGLVSAFVGAITGLSSSQYNKDNETVDDERGK